MNYPDWPQQKGVRHLQGWPLARCLDYGVTRISPSRWRYANQTATHWRCYVNAEKGAWLQANGKRMPVPIGCLYVIPPWFHYACGCDIAINHAFVHVDIPSLGRTFCEQHWPDPFILKLADWPPERLTRLLECLLEPDADETHIRCLLDSFASMFADGVLARLPSAPRKRTAFLHDLPPVLQLVCSYIDAHLEESLPVFRLADIARMSEAHFSRHMRQHTGYSPTQYVLYRRIVRGIWLLTNTDDSIEHIATRCGFHQRSYFSRTMKRLTGRSPADYRN